MKTKTKVLHTGTCPVEKRNPKTGEFLGVCGTPYQVSAEVTIETGEAPPRKVMLISKCPGCGNFVDSVVFDSEGTEHQPAPLKPGDTSPARHPSNTALLQRSCLVVEVSDE